MNFAEVEDEVFAPKKRRKRNNDPENAAIVQAITRPVMEEIDTKLLAPYVSPLFKRFFKRQRINGRRVLRRKSEMDMVMFKDVIRPILRRLLGRLRLPVKDQVAVYSKYYRVAIAIVKKRRANHVQSWRVHGKPKKPIYDVLLPPHHESQLVSELSELPGDGDDKMGEEASQLQKDRHNNMGESQRQEGRDFMEESQVQQESQVQEESVIGMDVESEECAGADAPLIERAETVTCVDCKCQIPKGYSFPQNTQEWASNNKNDHRCKTSG